VFREGITGKVILLGDADYHSARRVFSFNPQTDKYPQMIVRCAEPEDATKAVRYAREKQLDVAVRSGGHDLLGASVCDGLVIDLSRMNTIRVDRDARTVRVEAGARSSVLNGATQASEFAVPLGCHPDVGVAGLTLGGGIGWLTGKHGATCDNLLGADVVTADGKMLRTSATENSDLFGHYAEAVATLESLQRLTTSSIR
jgi:FAD/FMN-containing dehydrogenase